VLEGEPVAAHGEQHRLVVVLHAGCRVRQRVGMARHRREHDFAVLVETVK
jgi:hypothetical protein